MQDSKVANYSVIFIALVLLALVLQTFQAVLRPLAVASLLVFLVNPLSRFSKSKKIPVWFTFTALIVAFLLLLNGIGSSILSEYKDFEKSLPQIEQKIRQSSGEILDRAAKFGFSGDVITPDKLSKYAAKFLARGMGAVKALLSEALLVLILLMFLLQSYSGLFAHVESRYGPDEVARLKYTNKRIEGDIIAYFGTKTVVSIGTALVSAAILFLFKAKFIFISMLAIFFLNFVPVIGSIVAVVIVMLLYLFVAGVSVQFGWLALLLMAVQLLFGSILEPKITGSRLNMSPILIILSLYVWGWIWGLIGMLLSVPLTLFVMITVKHLSNMSKDGDRPLTA